MAKEDLIKKQIASLSDEEKNQRNLYLRELANGTLQGPPVGYASVDKPWLKYYSETFLKDYIPNLSVYDNLVESNRSRLANTAITYLGKIGTKLTYRELINRIDSVAKSFAAMGVKKGDVVTISLANTPEYVISFYALSKLGAISNFIDPRLKGEKLIEAINSTDSKFILYTDVFSSELDRVIDKTSIENIVIVSPFDSLNVFLKKILKLKKGKINITKTDYVIWDNFERIGKSISLDIDYKPNLDDGVCIVHTSGTTGNPKGVLLTHRNFAAMANQMKNNGFVSSNNGTFLNEIPTFLAYNIFATTNNPLTLGLNVIMLPDYNPEKFDKLILKYKPESLIVGPNDWYVFSNSNKLKGKDLSFIKTAISGSDKIDETIKSKINDKLQAGGSKARLLEGYGMSEVGSAAVANLPQITVPNSVGIPFKNVNICIYDNDNNTELGYNEVGEICLSGKTLMKCYYKKDDETNNVIRTHNDGVKWLHTGDIGYINKDGVLFLKGRIKRIIIRHDGIKVSPYDIERVIMGTGLVKDCCVVGIKDNENGHGSVPIANIVLNTELEYETEKVIDIIKNTLAKELGEKYQPYNYYCYDTLPLTNNGKVDYIKIQEDNEKEFNSSKALKLI